MREFKDLKIAVAGTGYVGLSIATLLSQHHQVTAVDIIPEKVDLINNKKSPIQDDYIEKYLAEKELNLTATLDAKEAYSDADFVVIAAPTNYDSKKNFFDTSAVEAVIKLVIEYNPEAIMVIKSTIPVGYTTSVREKFHCDNIIFSPEFLRESKALYDNLYPSRIIVGTDINNARLVKAAHTFAELLQEGAIKEDIDVLNRSLKPYVADRPFDIIRLIYFGRVSESKNVDVVIKVAGKLEKRGYNTLTTIIGGYTENYKVKLNHVIEKCELDEDKVQILGQQPFERICEELQKAHFFVFPSQEKMEGHSNSLTEAMTFGVVPVVSTAGFNASIVSNEDLVVSDINPKRYADVIEAIIKRNVWAEYSLNVYKRIKENYTEDIVKKAIVEAVSGLNDRR